MKSKQTKKGRVMLRNNTENGQHKIIFGDPKYPEMSKFTCTLKELMYYDEARRLNEKTMMLVRKADLLNKVEKPKIISISYKKTRDKFKFKFTPKFFISAEKEFIASFSSLLRLLDDIESNEFLLRLKQILSSKPSSIEGKTDITQEFSCVDKNLFTSIQKIQEVTKISA